MPTLAKVIKSDTEAATEVNNAPLTDASEMRTSIEFARLLNEARILLDRVSSGATLFHVGPTIQDFERRCREQVGPIIEKKR